MPVIVRMGGSGAQSAHNLQITQNPTKTAYNLGEQLDLTGMVVQAVYADGSTRTLGTSQYTTFPANGTILDKTDTRIRIDFTAGDDTTLTTYLAISVKYCESISVTTLPTTEYLYNQQFDSTGMVVKANYNDGSSAAISSYSLSITSGTRVAKGTTNITVSATVLGEDFTTSFDIFGKYCTKIEVKTAPTKVKYNLGEKFSSSGLVIKASYNDGTTANVSCTLSPANNTTLAKTDSSVLASYVYATETKTCSIPITVVYCKSISVTTAPTKTSYISGETLDTTGMVVKANYSDNTSGTISGYSTTPTNGSTLTSSNTTITVAATVLTESFTCTTPITVKYVTSIAVATAPSKTTYLSGDSLDLTGLTIRATYNDNSTAIVTGWSANPVNGTTLSTTNTSVTISYSNNGSVLTCSQAISVTNPVYTWASGTVAQIQEMFAAVDEGKITLSNYWAVGDERTVTIAGNVNETVKYVVIDLGTDGVKTTSGGTAFHALVGQKNALAATRQMNSSNTNAGGYNATTMKTYIDGDYTNGMQAATSGNFFDLVKSSSHYHNDGGGTTNQQLTENVKFILHSEYEIFGSNTYASNENTHCKHIEYYKTSSNRVKTAGESGSAVVWWLRSASDVEHTSINNTDFCEVGYSEGDKSKVYHDWAWNQWSSGNYVRATNYGVAPFCAI